MGMRTGAQHGFSLIELMIAMVLGLLLTAGLLSIFLTNKQMYNVQDGRARIQENGRFALNVLVNKARTAGYRGCASAALSQAAADNNNPAINNVLNDSGNYLYDFEVVVQGAEAEGSTWYPALDSSISNPDLIKGSDVVTFRGISDDQMIPVKAQGHTSPEGSADIKIVSNSGFENDDIVMVSDCERTAVFQITNLNPNGINFDNVVHNTGSTAPGNDRKHLGHNYEDGELYKMETVSFFIRKNSNGVPALYRRVDDNPVQELVEGVEEMQLLYGVDINGDGSVDEYATARTVVDSYQWDEVISVRISLLLSTLSDHLTVDGPQEYTFDGATVMATDNRIRASFTQTVVLRNRAP